MNRLVVGVLIGALFFVVGALAEDLVVTTTGDGTNVPLDFDQDGVIDTMDACPGTPPGSIIINPSDNPSYAGCTCEQVRPLINTSSPCVKFYCFQELLEIRYDMQESTFVDCPEDYCEGFTYHDYTKDGYTSCVNGELKEYVCTKTLWPDATICGYEPPVEENTAPETNSTQELNDTTEDVVITDEPASTTTDIAVTEETTEPITSEEETQRPEDVDVLRSTYYLTDATINYSYPQALREGEDATFQLQFTTDKAGMGIDPTLTMADGTLIELKDVNCTDVESTHVCVGTWDLPTDKERDENLLLGISYTTSEDTVNRNIDVPISVKEKPFIAQPVTAPIIKDMEPKEEILARAIHEEYAEEESSLIKDADVFIQKMRETARYVVAQKEAVYNEETNTTTVALVVEPNPGIIANNITIIEYIPKDVAASVADIAFATEPTTILNDDPLVMWHFAAVDERVELSYEVKGNVPATGNTIVVADDIVNDKSPWFIIIPILMIPLLVILFIFMPRITHHHEE